MEFELNSSINILSQTPNTLSSLLTNLPEAWLNSNEGAETWSPKQILNHLVHGERTDWVSRIKVILSENDDKSFKPFDREGSVLVSDQSILQILDDFRIEREKSLAFLFSLELKETDHMKTGVHPEFGEVTLKQLISTWAVHDLGHIAQICRVLAKQYKEEVGPWVNYLSILTR